MSANAAQYALRLYTVLNARKPKSYRRPFIYMVHFIHLKGADSLGNNQGLKDANIVIHVTWTCEGFLLNTECIEKLQPLPVAFGLKRVVSGETQLASEDNI